LIPTLFQRIGRKFFTNQCLELLFQFLTHPSDARACDLVDMMRRYQHYPSEYLPGHWKGNILLKLKCGAQIGISKDDDPSTMYLKLT